MDMIHALILAASVCSMGASVQNADALLSKADAAIAQGNDASARAFYDSAMDDLNAADWVPKDASCAEPGYAFQKYLTMLHSLSVGVADGSMPPSQAVQHLHDMIASVYRLLPLSGWAPDLKNTERKYVLAIESAAQPQRIAAHEPKGPACEPRDVKPEVLEAVPAYPSDSGDPINNPSPVVSVGVDADGNLTSVEIRGSGNGMVLDQAALRAARESIYLPAVKNCVPTADYFNITVTFSPGG
jgi:TonB family protein